MDGGYSFDMEQLVSVELMDYRDLPKCGRKFDRIVSVGMVKHVGRDNPQPAGDAFLRGCGRVPYH